MHVIRLRRPWEKRREGDPDAARIDVPETESSPSETATYLYRRNFRRPTGLETDSQVYLRIEGWEGRLESATVNDTSLNTEGESVEAEISGILQSQNHVALRLTSLPDRPARLSGQVTLAIDDGGIS